MSRRSSIGGLVCAVIALVCATSAVAAGPADGQGRRRRPRNSRSRSEVAACPRMAGRQAGKTDATAFARKHPTRASASSPRRRAQASCPRCGSRLQRGHHRHEPEVAEQLLLLRPSCRLRDPQILGRPGPGRRVRYPATSGRALQPGLLVHRRPDPDTVVRRQFLHRREWLSNDVDPQQVDRWLVVHHRPGPNLQRSALRDQPAV